MAFSQPDVNDIRTQILYLEREIEIKKKSLSTIHCATVQMEPYKCRHCTKEGFIYREKHNEPWTVFLNCFHYWEVIWEVEQDHDARKKVEQDI